MRKFGYFLYYLTIDTFAWLILFAISINFLWEWLAGILGVLTFFALFPIAWSQADERVNPKSSQKNNDKSQDVVESNSGISFTISTSYGGYDDEDHEEVKKAKWAGKGENIEIQGHKISDPFIYVTDSGKKSPACHVVPSKLKANNRENFDNIGYWPSYSDLNTGQRGMFLNWLAEGKSDSKIDIGYVFIYFYGLEYRVLKDKKDYEAIAKEIIRLREHYRTNNSFKGYSEGLLAYILSNLENKALAQELFLKVEPTLEKYSYLYRSGINLKVRSTRQLSEKEVISSISNFENVPRSSIPNKVGSYFDQYFKIIASNEIAEAISTIEPKEYNERYYSASSYLRDEYSYKGLRIIVDRKMQNKLGKKWTQAVDDFRPYSRKLSKHSPSEIFNLLPQELRQNMDHPLKDQIEQIEKTSLGKVITLSDLASALGFNSSDKLKQKDAREIVETLLSANIIIEPNIAYFKKSYSLSEKVILSKSRNAKMLDFDDYKLAALMADFGADLAYSDNDYSDSEAEQIYSIISTEFLKKDIEKEHLKLRVNLYREAKPKMNGVFKKLSEKLGISELKVLSDYLVRVALADGLLTKEEDKKIRAALEKLGLENTYVDDLYAKFGAKGDFQNVELRQGAGGVSKGSLIPKKEKGIVLDREKLSQLAADTEKVKSVLSEIIVVEEEHIPQQPAKQQDEEEIALDEKHEKFMEQVVSKSEWDKKELREKAKEHSLMINAAISKINDWAEEKYGDYLIFEDEKYRVQSSILSEEKDCA